MGQLHRWSRQLRVRTGMSKMESEYDGLLVHVLNIWICYPRTSKISAASREMCVMYLARYAVVIVAVLQ